MYMYMYMKKHEKKSHICVFIIKYFLRQKSAFLIKFVKNITSIKGKLLEGYHGISAGTS